MSSVERPCGLEMKDHVWNEYRRAGLLERVECDVCGITPQRMLELRTYDPNYRAASSLQEEIRRLSGSGDSG